MDFSAWTVDLNRRCATHNSGFRVEVEGNPKNPSAVHPGKFPAGSTSLEQVRLLRTGIEALAKAAQGHGAAASAGKPTYQAPPNKPQRSTLSLKKRPQ